MTRAWRLLVVLTLALAGLLAPGCGPVNFTVGVTPVTPVAYAPSATSLRKLGISRPWRSASST